MWNENVCRLCLSEKELCNVFDNGENQVDNLKRIVFITTGVEILQDDVISRKICESCRKVTVKMYEFRNCSSKTDKYLKDQYAIHLRKTQARGLGRTVEKNASILKAKSTKPRSKNKKKIPRGKSNVDELKTVHFSVSKLFTACPNIKIPKNVLFNDIDPIVYMELDAVENYYIENNLDMTKAVQSAVRSLRLPKKKSNPNSVKKRKLCDTSETPTLLETLKLQPKVNFHLCQICASLHPSFKSLNKHIGEHFRCSYCKTKFKLHSSKETHENACVVKRILTTETYVNLTKMDFNNMSVLIPDVRINGDSNLFDAPMTELELLKRLLTKNSSTDMKLLVPAETQSEYPEKIVKHQNGLAARFKVLKQQLYGYKIPVYIEKGEFDVSYAKTVPRRTITDDKCLWSNLTPIGLKKSITDQSVSSPKTGTDSIKEVRKGLLQSKVLIPVGDQSVSSPKSGTSVDSMSTDSIRVVGNGLPESNNGGVVPNCDNRALIDHDRSEKGNCSNMLK